MLFSVQSIYQWSNSISELKPYLTTILIRISRGSIFRIGEQNKRFTDKFSQIFEINK